METQRKVFPVMGGFQTGKSYKWWVLAMLSCTFFFHQADRALFGLMTVPIQRDLGLSDIQIGWINTVLSWTLAAMTLVAGFAGDRFSRKRIICSSLVFWSLATMMLGFSGDWKIGCLTIPVFFVVMFFRSIATGGGESFYAPSAMALLASHHRRTRSSAFSIHQAALYIGLMTSGFIVAKALGFFGGSWRSVFVSFGGAGIVLGAVLAVFLKDAGKEHAEEKKEPAAGIGEALRAFFLNPSALAATVGFIAIVFVNNAYLFWSAKFMEVKFGVDTGRSATDMMFYHHLFAFAAIIAGGFISDRFSAVYPRFRLGSQIIALLGGAPCLVMMSLAPSAPVMVAMSALYGVFRGAFEVNTHASVFDVIAPRYRSTAVGCMVMSAFFFGGFSGVAMGALSQRGGVAGFEMGFSLLGAVYVFAAAVMSLSFFFTFRKNRLLPGDEKGD